MVRISLSISISSRLGVSRPLAIVVDRVAGVAIAVVVESAIGKGEWHNLLGLLFAISGLNRHNLLGDQGVVVVGEVAIGVGVASVATVCEPWVSLGISIGSGLGLPLAVVVMDWVAVADGVVEGHNGLLLLNSLSFLHDREGVVGVVGAVGEAMGVGVASVDQVRVGVGLWLSLSGCKCGKRSNEKSPDHPSRMVPC